MIPTTEPVPLVLTAEERAALAQCRPALRRVGGQYARARFARTKPSFSTHLVARLVRRALRLVEPGVLGVGQVVGRHRRLPCFGDATNTNRCWQPESRKKPTAVSVGRFSS